MSPSSKINFPLVAMITLAVLLLAVGFYLGFYPNRFLFYEEMKIIRIYNWIFIPLLSTIFIMKTRSVFMKSKRTSTYRKGTFIKSRLLSLVWLFGLYWLFLRPCFVGLVMYINTEWGQQVSTHVAGKTIRVVNKPGGGKTLAIYRLIVESDTGKTYNFTTTKTQVMTHPVNRPITVELQDGSLGILYGYE